MTVEDLVYLLAAGQTIVKHCPKGEKKDEHLVKLKRAIRRAGNFLKKKV